MNLCFLTPWAQHSPFYEFSLSLAEEMHKLEHEIFALAPAFSDSLPQIAGQSDGEGVMRFSPETTGEEILKQLADWKIDTLLVHAECFPDRRKLELIIKGFTQEVRRSYLFIHEENYQKEVPYSSFTGLFLPNRSFTVHPPGHTRVFYLEQGIPEFKFEEDLFFRSRMQLPIETIKEGDEENTEGYYLATLDGSTNIKDLVDVLEYINQYKLTPKPLYVFVQCANHNNFSLYGETESDYVYYSFGYLSPMQLAAYFHHSDGAIFIYPETRFKRTSSAIRFAIGAGASVITNIGNHMRDLEEGIVTLAKSSDKESIKHAIVSHFTNPGFRKINAKRITKLLADRMGWSKVAKELEDILLNRKAKNVPAHVQVS